VVVNINVRDDLKDFPRALQAQFWTYLERCTTQVGDVEDPDSYFDTQVYRVNDSCRTADGP
jgi:hypothetical protein